MGTPKHGKRKAGDDWVARAVGVLGVLAAVAALALNCSQAGKLEAYHRVTTQPLLGIDRIFSPTEGYDGVGVYLHNYGNGVGLLVEGEVTYGGISLEHANGQFAGMAAVIRSRYPTLPTLEYSGPRLGALNAGDQRLLLGISIADYTPEYGQVLEGFIRGMSIRFGYRSMYDDETFTTAVSPDLH
jgi:hypothetical protein